MRKCCAYEVLTPIVSLARHCSKGVQFSWGRYMCREFLDGCCEAHEEGKPFHYAWLFLLIALIAWRAPEEFPTMDLDICEAMWYASLWASKDPIRAMENKMFSVLFEMELHMVINQWSQLSLALFSQYRDVPKFKANFHNVYICAKKDLMEDWHAMPYLVA